MSPRDPAGALLRGILPGVSRSFGLSLRILPSSLRSPLGITYLIARAADTFADTRAVPPVERAERIEALRAAVHDSPGGLSAAGLATRLGGPPAAGPRETAEERLLARLPDVLAAYHALPAADRARAGLVLDTLTGAMLDTLRRFPPEDAGRLEALDTLADLDRYTYGNAGCVGEFWTDMMAAHRRRWAGWSPTEMRARGARFGHGLQLVNVLRDLPRDLRLGRCYLPRTELRMLGLAPTDLLDPAVEPRLRPLIDRLVDRALGCFEDALAYTRALPILEARLRLACALPLLIGLGTLARLRRTEHLLDPSLVVKVPRSEVRRHLAWAPLLVVSNRALGRYAHRLARAAREPPSA
jgi:farnesyl-diphosphate farnesyltransferase